MFLWEACSKRKDETEVARGHILGYRRLGVGERRGSGGDKHICGALAVLIGTAHWVSRFREVVRGASSGLDNAGGGR